MSRIATVSNAGSTLALFNQTIADAWHHLLKRDIANAMLHARQAALIDPDSPETTHILGLLASRDGRSDIAIPLLEKTLAAGKTERRLRDLAEALLVAGKPEQALVLALQASQYNTAESYGLLAAVYVAQDNFNEAEIAAKKAIALNSSLMAWEGTLSFCHLIQKKFIDGFKYYTGRSQNLTAGSTCPALNFASPDHQLNEIWLKNEQGPGDTIFYARFAAKLAALGWKIHLQTDKKTKVLLRNTGVFSSVKESLAIPANALVLNLGDLPLAAIQLGEDHTPAPLKFTPDEQRVKKIREKLASIGPAPYIAVTWRAGARGAKQRAGLRMYDKSISPHEIGQSLSKTNATIVSIQRVPDAEEQHAFASGLGREFIDFSHYNDNLQDMLALLSCIDEYVTVPNTNVHLRESLGLGAQVFVNRPYQDWRWLAEGDETPWYPNCVIYRQDAGGGWNHANIKLKTHLGQWHALPNTNFTQAITTSVALPQQTLLEDKATHLFDIGWSALNAGDISSAIQSAQSIIKLYADQQPPQENSDALHLLGWAAMLDNKIDIAAGVLGRAATLSPTEGRIIGDYVRALSAAKKYEQALEVATQAIHNSQTINLSGLYYGRASAYMQLNRLHEAIADYEQSMRIGPNRLDTPEYCGMARLKIGDAKLGFKLYTARKVAKREALLNDWCCPRLTKAHAGSHVLIKRDMGLGDELTYLRYLPWLTDAGIKVDYWAGKKLVPILARMGYFNQVFSDADQAPDRDDYDLSFIVNELPLAVDLLDAPAIAPPLPLTPKKEYVEKWQSWLASCGEGPYIGFNWRAGAAASGVAEIHSKLAKAIDADALANTLAPIKATWVSLQRNVMMQDLRAFEATLQAPVHDASGLTDDLEDLLALVYLLDENIGVSNTNMHLRASLGKDSKVLVQMPGGDWRWGYEGNQSLWFTESKIYRQTLDGGWQEALQALQDDLTQQYGLKAKAERALISTETKKTAQSNRIIWLTAGVINNNGTTLTSDLASARYRVIAPSTQLKNMGWTSEYVNEQSATLKGGWGSSVPQAGDTVVISKVFTDFALKLASDAKARGAQVVVDFCDNFLTHKQRGPLQHSLLKLADKVIASTKEMADALVSAGRHANAIISDPVELSKGLIKFKPKTTLQLLWFGHAVNIDTLIQFSPKLTEYAKTQKLELTVVTNLPNGLDDLDKISPLGLNVKYIPWSIDATQKAISACDIVVIPTISSEIKKAKSPNRLLEPLWAGRMVVAGTLPAYCEFEDSAWVGKDLIEGINWCLANPENVINRIATAQKKIEENFSVSAIANRWHEVFIKDKQPDSVLVSKNEAKAELAILTTQRTNLPSIAIRLVEPFSLITEYDAVIASTTDKNGALKLDYQALLMRDLVIVQRDFPSNGTMPLLKKLKSLGKKLIYETDDAFHLIPEDHPKAFHRAKAPAIFEFAKMADLITVSTEALAKEFSPYVSVAVVPNRLSPNLWHADLLNRHQQARATYPSNQIRVGVVGGADHSQDLAIISEAISTVAEKQANIIWVAYGDGALAMLKQTLPQTNIEAQPSNFDYTQHPQRLADLALDIALVPLVDNAFNQCRSNLKFLEYGYLAVPAVYSNVESYNTTVVDGETGLLASNTTKSWVKAINTLIEQADLRAKLGKAAKQTIEQHWMLSKQHQGWGNILDSIK